MLTLEFSGASRRFCDGVSRRGFLRIGSLGLGAGALAGAGLPALLHAGGDTFRRSHRAVIMIYLPGGPTQIDLVDPKPDAPKEVRGPFGSIPAATPGLRICELLPKLARNSDKLVVVRSLVGMRNRHESFQCYTGRPGGRSGDREPAGGWPALGSVVSRLLGPAVRGVPPYIDVGPKMGYGPYNNSGLHDASPLSSWPGFLGFAHTPFQLHGAGGGDLVIDGVRLDRLRERRTLLERLESLRRAIDARGAAGGFDEYRAQAFEILTASRLAHALDLDAEDPRTRERYGASSPTTASFGGAPKDPQQLLLARRLVEAGARCVTVAFGAWDWHGNRGGPVEKLGREDFPAFDHALATLLEDLDSRGLLDTVSVVVWGEFGRTPKINAKGGRDHWERVGCALLAGGGMRTGQVIGATDAHGAEAVERPVHVQEVFATLYDRLGIDTGTATVTDLAGRPRYLVDGNRAPLPEVG